MPEVFIQGGEGKLQAKYSPSEQEKPNIAIILHPNPKHGGTMDTKVNYAAFKVMKDAGFSTLRINFRGVGKSDGAFTEGEGELNDASVEFRVTGEYTQANRVDEEVKDEEFDTLLEVS